MPRSSSPVRLVDKDGKPVFVTDDGELWTTVTERENDVWSQYANTFNADTYIILVDLDNPAFPHTRQGQPTSGRVDGTSLYYAIDLAANTSAIVRYGVITRIDGTNADIKYFAGLPFVSGAQQDVIVESLRGVPSQVKLDFNNAGVLLHGVTNSTEEDVAAVNTGLTLDSPIGVVTPGLGDMIMKYEHTAGSAIMAVFIFYHVHGD